MSTKLTATDWIWRDGEFVRWEDANVHVLSHSMQYGSSAFEGVRCYDTPRGPSIFRLDAHLQRLLTSCRIYRMDVTYSIDDLTVACCQLVEKNGLEACYLRPMVLRGYGAASMVPFASPIHVYLPCWPWGAYLGDDAVTKGVRMKISSWARHDHNTMPPSSKTTGNYVNSSLAKVEALRRATTRRSC